MSHGRIPGGPDIDLDDALPITDDVPVVTAAVEAKELVPTLKLKVACECNNTAGKYVALNGKQRTALGVAEGDSVVLKENGKVVGVFTVGKGLSKLKQGPDYNVEDPIGANGVTIGAEFELQKATAESLDFELQKLSLSGGLEADAKHVTRAGKIKERFPGFDGTSYIALPTAVATSIMYGAEDVKLGKPTVAAISLGKVKIGDKVMEIPVVPTGTDFAMTSKAATDLGVTTSPGAKVDFYVKDGVLVINQIGE